MMGVTVAWLTIILTDIICHVRFGIFSKLHGKLRRERSAGMRKSCRPYDFLKSGHMVYSVYRLGIRVSLLCVSLEDRYVSNAGYLDLW